MRPRPKCAQFSVVKSVQFSIAIDIGKRSALERLNARLDNDFRFGKHTLRGQARLTARVGLALAIMTAMALGGIRANAPERMRSLIRSPPQAAQPLHQPSTPGAPHPAVPLARLTQKPPLRPTRHPEQGAKCAKPPQKALWNPMRERVSATPLRQNAALKGKKRDSASETLALF